MTTCLYDKNLYSGNNFLANAAVVDGVYVVDRPITPIFKPLANEYNCDDPCFGRKSLLSVYERRLAAKLGASFPAMNGNKKLGPKSN